MYPVRLHNFTCHKYLPHHSKKTLIPPATINGRLRTLVGPKPPKYDTIIIVVYLQSVSLLVTVVDYDRVGGNEPIGKFTIYSQHK